MIPSRTRNAPVRRRYGASAPHGALRTTPLLWVLERIVRQYSDLVAYPIVPRTRPSKPAGAGA